MIIPYIIPRTRKGWIILLSILAFACLLTAGILYSSYASDQKMLEEKGQPDFNTLSIDQLENNLIVNGTIVLAFDHYAESYETNMGIRTSSKSEELYYVIPVVEIDEEGYLYAKYVISFLADKKHFDVMDRIFDQTWFDTDYYAELQIENGRIVDLPNDVKPYFTQWLEDPFFYEGGTFVDWCVEYDIFGTQDREVIKSKITPYMIKEFGGIEANRDNAWILLAIGIALLLILLVLIFIKKPVKPSVEQEFSELREMDDGPQPPADSF